MSDPDQISVKLHKAVYLPVNSPSFSKKSEQTTPLKKSIFVEVGKG
jgi:hypothetical protein